MFAQLYRPLTSLFCLNENGRSVVNLEGGALLILPYLVISLLISPTIR